MTEIVSALIGMIGLLVLFMTPLVVFAGGTLHHPTDSDISFREVVLAILITYGGIAIGVACLWGAVRLAAA